MRKQKTSEKRFMSDIEDHYDGEPHSMIDKYRIVRKLGTGTFGRVFLCNTVVERSGLPSKSANKMYFKQGKKIGKKFDSDRARRDEEALQEAEAAV
jgi:serine/threonine protein kinase